MLPEDTVAPPTLSPLGMAALTYATEYGWPVFPVQRRGKVPLISKDQGGHGVHDATTDPDQIAAWWEQYPEANIGLRTGAASGIYVVDLDGPVAEETIAAYGEMPETPVNLTANGRHLLFAYPVGVELRNTAKKKLGAGVDTRGEGGYVVAPPSLHPSGYQYTWGTAPDVCELAPIPAPILAALTRTAVSPPAAPLFDQPAGSGPDVLVVGVERRAADIPFLESLPEGSRNQTLAEYAGRLLAKGMGELETLQLVQALNRDKGRPPLGRDEVERIVGSIAGAEQRKRAGQAGAWDAEPSRAAADAPAGGGLVRVGHSAFSALAERNARAVDAVPTMLPAWNRACRGDGGGEGLPRGWHITVAGSSGAGKSLCALNVAATAIRHGHSVGFISLEMSQQQLLARLLAIYSGANAQSLEPGRLYDPHAFDRAYAEFLADCEHSGAHLYIAERPSGEAHWVTTEMRRAADEGVRIQIVDYMQCLEFAGAGSLEETMRKASRAVQRVSFDCNVTTIGLSQYNRSMSFNKDAPPNKHGLTGSSGIENDSDQVLLLDHSVQQRHGHLMNTNLILDKNRHGPQPTIGVQWDYSTLRLTERAPAGVFDEEALEAQRSRGPAPKRSQHAEYYAEREVAA